MIFKENKNLNISVSESAFLYFQKPFDNLNMQFFKLSNVDNIDFEIRFSYSYDNHSWSAFKKQEDYDNFNIDDKFPLYVCIWFRRIYKNDIDKPKTLFPKNIYDETSFKNEYYDINRCKNVDVKKPSNVGQELPHLTIESIFYHDIQFKECDVKIQQFFKLIDELPRWNIYDNQYIHVKRWLQQCNSIAEQYGHTVIWFKTEPLDVEPTSDDIKRYREDFKQSGIHGIHSQLATNVIRNIVDIKRLHIVIPNNEIPQDRNVYTEWDLALQDDFIIHVVREKFEQAFGLNSIPQEKDFLYFPLLNKLYRVSTMQPKNGFMGVIGWYEVFLAKYEEDDSVVGSDITISTDLKDAVSGIPEMFNGIEKLNPETIEIQNSLWDELNEFKEDTVMSETNVKTIKEERIATESYTNKLEDSTFYVNLKENEKIREFYHKRLNIVSVNSETSSFPINMYDCSKVEANTVALQYSLKDYSLNIKPDLHPNKSFDFSFGLCLTGINTNTEIFRLYINEQCYVSINIKRGRLFVSDNYKFINIEIDKKLEKQELYRFDISYQEKHQAYVVKLFEFKKNKQEQIYSDIFKLNEAPKQNYDFKKLEKVQLFGGNFLINEVAVYIDKVQLLHDKCLPLLQMYKF